MRGVKAADKRTSGRKRSNQKKGACLGLTWQGILRQTPRHITPMRSLKKSETFTTLELPDGNLALTESEKNKCLIGNVQGYFPLAIDTHVNLEIPEISEVCNRGPSYGPLNKFRAAGPDGMHPAIVRNYLQSQSCSSAVLSSGRRRSLKMDDCNGSENIQGRT